jgi:hypothetical protein
MAFKSQAEQNKWNALQNTGGQTIEKLLKGEATPDDITKLSKLVSDQSKLAGKLFDEGIAGVESTADALIDKMNQNRIAIGKNPLTPKAQDRLFKQTFQNVLKAATEDILGSVHDQLAEQTESIQDSLDTVTERLHKIQTERRTREEQEAPIRSLSDKVGSLVSSIRASGIVTSGTSSLRKLATKSREVLESGKEVAGKGIRQFGEAIRNPRRTIDNTTTYLRSSVGAMKDAVVDGWRKLTNKNETDDEDKKSSTWLRKLKSLFGSGKDKLDKGKRAASFLGKLFGPIGKVLLLALANPQLIKTITDAVSKYLNFDTISDFVDSTWKDIKKGGADIVDWILDKIRGTADKKVAANSPNTVEGKAAIATSVAQGSQIPANTSASDARAAIPEIESKIKATKVALSRAQDRLSKDPSDDNKISVRNNTIRLQILQGQLDNYKKVTGVPTAKPADTKTLTSTSAGSTGGTDSTTVTPTALTGATGPSPASIAASTTAVGSMPQFKEGIAIETPRPDQALSEGNKTAGNAAPGGGIVSLGSFGYNSGDDTLNLLNMGLIG